MRDKHVLLKFQFFIYINSITNFCRWASGLVVVFEIWEPAGWGSIPGPARLQAKPGTSVLSLKYVALMTYLDLGFVCFLLS